MADVDQVQEWLEPEEEVHQARKATSTEGDLQKTEGC